MVLVAAARFHYTVDMLVPAPRAMFTALNSKVPRTDNSSQQHGIVSLDLWLMSRFARLIPNAQDRQTHLRSVILVCLLWDSI